MLLSGTGSPVSSLTRPGEGTYTVNRTTGVIVFTPQLGHLGIGSPVSYRVADSQGQTATGTYTTTVTPGGTHSSPAHVDGHRNRHAAGHGHRSHRRHATLLNGSAPVSVLAIPDEGGYAVNATTGVITFTPQPGYVGTATPVAYRVVDPYGQSAESTYTPTVTLPAAPVAVPLTSTGVGTTVQSLPVAIPAGGGAIFYTGQKAVSTIPITGQGIYRLDSVTGIASFTPDAAFAGTAASVTYVVVDSYGQTGTSTYTATVTLPAPPTAPPLGSTGAFGDAQQQTVPIPPGGSVMLLDGSTPVTSLTIPGQGAYVLNALTGVITFTPLAGYSGHATPVAYQVTDAYGQSVRSTYAAAVAADLPTAGPAQAAVTSVVTADGGGIPTSVPAGSGGQAATSGSALDEQLLLGGLGFMVLGGSVTSRRRRRTGGR